VFTVLATASFAATHRRPREAAAGPPRFLGNSTAAHDSLPAGEVALAGQVRWRFGLDDEDELTLKEIGDQCTLSCECIRQLQEQALGKMRKQMRDD
jgi:sigma-70-like protein